MIEYRPGYTTRNEEIVAELRRSAGAAGPTDIQILIKRKAAELASAMALFHGGDWRVQVDHDEGFALVVRRGRRQTL